MGALKAKDYPLADKGRAWDGDAAEARIRKWAGGPDKDKIDWSKYGSCYLWYDENDKKNFGSYKLLYVDIIDGGPHIVFKALTAIISAINGARGGTKIPAEDKKKVYNEAARLYKKFDEEPPEYKG